MGGKINFCCHRFGCTQGVDKCRIHLLKIHLMLCARHVDVSHVVDMQGVSQNVRVCSSRLPIDRPAWEA